MDMLGMFLTFVVAFALFSPEALGRWTANFVISYKQTLLKRGP
jgi:hypothetical protein